MIREGKSISDGDDVYKGRAEHVLVSLSDSYSDDEISVNNSRPSFCSAYTIY